MKDQLLKITNVKETYFLHKNLIQKLENKFLINVKKDLNFKSLF